MPKATYYPSPKRQEKLTRGETLDLTFDLINAFQIVQTPFETTMFLQDLLTHSEIKHLAKRLRIAKLLLEERTQRDIAHEVHCSLATITKVSLWLSQGGEGLKHVLSKLPTRYEIPKNLPPIPVEFQLPKVLYALAQYSAAKRQGDKIKNLETFLSSLEGKVVFDKSIQEAFDQEFKMLASKKKED